MAIGLVLCLSVTAQELKPLDAYLTTVNYPYPENYIKFESGDRIWKWCTWM